MGGGDLELTITGRSSRRCSAIERDMPSCDWFSFGRERLYGNRLASVHVRAAPERRPVRQRVVLTADSPSPSREAVVGSRVSWCLGALALPAAAGPALLYAPLFPRASKTSFRKPATSPSDPCTQGWSLKVIEEAAAEMGGFKTVIAEVNGEKVYSKLKYEAGVHRVQVTLERLSSRATRRVPGACLPSDRCFSGKSATFRSGRDPPAADLCY